MLSLDVPSKVGRRNESLVTDVATEWFFTRMSTLMSLQCSKLGETLGAVLTLIGAFSCMFVHMSLQVAVLSE